MDEKAAFEEVEKGRPSLGHIDDVALKHGDRALAIIGDERVTLTDEEVRLNISKWQIDSLKLMKTTNRTSGYAEKRTKSSSQSWFGSTSYRLANSQERS